jgi:hypothetical protein
MGKYTALFRDGGEKPEGSIFNVNINNIHSSDTDSIDTPISDNPEDTLEGSDPVDLVQTGASGGEGGNAVTRYSFNAVIPSEGVGYAFNRRPATPPKANGVYVHKGDCPCQWCHYEPGAGR